MGIFSKIITAIRGGATEVGEAIVDSQAMRILDQEIRDAGEDLRLAKDELTKLMAKRKLADEDVRALGSKVGEYEGYLGQVLAREAPDGSLAAQDAQLRDELAAKIAELEGELGQKQSLAQEFAQRENSVKTAIRAAEGNLDKLKQRASMVKATDAVHKAQAQIASSHSGANARMSTAMDSLARLEQRQKEQSARFDAATQLEHETQGAERSLEDKLKASGLIGSGPSGSDVLARLRAKRLPDHSS